MTAGDWGDVDKLAEDLKAERQGDYLSERDRDRLADERAEQMFGGDR